VDLWSVGQRDELRLAWRIGRVRVSSKVMIERVVLVENYHHMFDRRGGVGGMNRRGCSERGRKGSSSEGDSFLCGILSQLCSACYALMTNECVLKRNLHLQGRGTKHAAYRILASRSFNN